MLADELERRGPQLVDVGDLDFLYTGVAEEKEADTPMVLTSKVLWGEWLTAERGAYGEPIRADFGEAIFDDSRSVDSSVDEREAAFARREPIDFMKFAEPMPKDRGVTTLVHHLGNRSREYLELAEAFPDKFPDVVMAKSCADPPTSKPADYRPPPGPSRPPQSPEWVRGRRERAKDGRDAEEMRALRAAPALAGGPLPLGRALPAVVAAVGPRRRRRRPAVPAAPMSVVQYR